MSLTEINIELPLRHGGHYRGALRFELLGPKAAPCVVVAGGISANRHVSANGSDAVAGWWETQVGPGRSIDTSAIRVLAIDWLGADGDLNVAIDTADQADAFAAVLDALGIAQLQAWIGSSYGAMVGLQFAARYPQRLQHLLAISGAHRAHPFASAWRSIQRKIVRLGAQSTEALALARQLAMLSYRTPEEFAQRFSGEVELHDGIAVAPAEAYLSACGQHYAERWSATAFLRLSESIDLHAVDPAAITVPTTLVAVSEDRLVPSADIYALGEGLRGTWRLHHLRSPYGHDAFLKEERGIATILSEVLAANCRLRVAA